MAIATSTAIALSIAAAASAYSAKTAADARSDANDQADQEMANANKLQKDAADKSTKDRLEADAATERALRKSKEKNASKTGRDGTILTSSTGLGGTGAGASTSTATTGSSKTILGG